MKTRAVTQSCTLPYRRLPVGRLLPSPKIYTALQSETLRHSAMELCVTPCKTFALACLCLAASFLCGCASGPDWTRRVYSFSLAADPPATNIPSDIVALNRVAISPLFQSRSFTYRTGENSYKQDPYAGFLILPERAMGESIRASMRAGGVFGRVVEPGSSLFPTLVAEVFVNELYGDFRNASRPIGKMEIHFLCYEIKDGNAGRIVLDKLYARETPLIEKTPGALMAAWDTDLREIMDQINSEFAKANHNEHE